MSDATAELEVLVQIRDAVSNLKTVAEESKKQSSKMETAFNAIKVAAAAAVAVFASKQILDFFSSGIDAAIAQENAMSGLAQQLQLTGDYSATAMDHFAGFADEMERSTNIGDDVVLGQIALAKSFGVSNAEAEKMVRAAIELSAATGKELEPTLRTLGKSLTGTLGPLDEQVVAMKGLTKAQLEAGEQFDLIIDRYGGSAAAKIETFSGAIEGAKNAWGNFQEVFGKVIVENPQVIAAISAIRDAFNFLTDTTSESEGALSAFVSGGINVVTATIAASIDVFTGMVMVVRGIGDAAADSLTALLALASIIPSFEDDATAMAVSIQEAKLASDDFLDGVRKGSQEAALKFNDTAEKIASAAKTQTVATKSIKTDSNTRTKAFEEEGKAAAKAMEKEIETADKNAATLRDIKGDGALSGSQQADLDAITQSAKDEADARAKVEKDARDARTQADREAAFSAIGSIVGSGDGKASAMAAGQMLGAGVADAFMPGLGQAVGPILGVLMQGPEATKAFIKDFIAAVPDIITAVAESAPVVVEALVDSLILDGGLIKIAVALTKAMAGEAVWKAIGKMIGLEFGNAFQMQNIGGTLRNAFAEGAAKLREMPREFNEAITRFQNAGHNAGTAISTAIRDQLPGIIKSGFHNSRTVIAEAVTSGLGQIGTSITDAINEAASSLGIPRPQWLDDLIAAFNPGGGGGGSARDPLEFFQLSGGDGTGGGAITSGDAILAILGRILEVLREERTITTSVKFNAKTLADLILELERRGVRTS